MRSAERHSRNAWPLGLLAAALLAGCGSVGTRLRDALPGASASAPAQGASAATPAASANAMAMAKPASTGPIAPATQRAYDDALALMRAGHPADAERQFRALAQSDPDLAGPHANLGVLARQAGHAGVAVTKAKGAYEHALAIDPNYATAVLNLGVLDDLYLGDGAHALELYTRYLALTPAGDPVVAKWVADVKNRQTKAAAPAASAPAAAAAPKEKS